MRHVVPSVAALVALAACDSTEPLTTGLEPGGASRAISPAATTGAVYTLSNAPDANAVVTYVRAANGTLTPGPVVPTGGKGLGASLGSQGALVRREAGDLLLAVNAGSDQVTLLRINGTTPQVLATVGSGGDRPVSVTVRGLLVFVLNAGENNNIAGFRLQIEEGGPGTLVPIPGSVRPLSAPNAGGAQIEFTPRGDALIVTEKMTNRILSYPVNGSGVVAAPKITPSAGMTPFGFTFAGPFNDVLVVSEAFGGAPNASAASSYKVGAAGALSLVSASVPTHQTAACWFVPTRDGRSAFATNTGSASISTYRIEANGVIRLFPPTGIAATTGAGPIDEARTPDGAYLYSLASIAHQIDGYSITGDALARVETEPGTPPMAAGLVAK